MAQNFFGVLTGEVFHQDYRTFAGGRRGVASDDVIGLNAYRTGGGDGGRLDVIGIGSDAEKDNR